MSQVTVAPVLTRSEARVYRDLVEGRELNLARDTKAIEARRELLATGALVERLGETDVAAAGPLALDHAAATREYLASEETAPLLPTVQLSPDEPVAHAKVGDYDHWIGFVCQKIDAACGFEVDVKARPWGANGPIEVMADDARGDRIREAMLDLRDAFLAGADAADGDGAFEADFTLTRDMHFRRLRLADGVTIYLNGYRLFVDEGPIDFSRVCFGRKAAPEGES